MLRGVTSPTQIALAFGVMPKRASVWMTKIRDSWQTRDKERTQEDRRTIRIKQLENIAILALSEFAQSKKNSKEKTVVSQPCRQCHGDKIVMDKNKICQTCEGLKIDETFPGQYSMCMDCNGTGFGTKRCRECRGTGETKINTLKVKQECGDPAYLTIAKAAFLECARLEGLTFDSRITLGKQLIEASAGVDGVISQKIEEIYFDAPVDVIIQAMAAMDELRRKGTRIDPPPNTDQTARGEPGTGLTIEIDPTKNE